MGDQRPGRRAGPSASSEIIGGMNRHLLLLALCQGLFLTNNVTFIAINGLVGLSLAPVGWMATLPVTGYVVGGAVSTVPVSRLQARIGRKRCFQLGLVVAALSAMLCAYAVSTQSFALLVMATANTGCRTSTCQGRPRAAPGGGATWSGKRMKDKASSASKATTTRER